MKWILKYTLFSVKKVNREKVWDNCKSLLKILDGMGDVIQICNGNILGILWLESYMKPVHVNPKTVFINEMNMFK